MCVCHHDTPVPNENTTSLRPSTLLRPSLPPTCLPASDHEDRLTQSMCYSFGGQYSGTCARQHSCALVLSGWIPKHVREHAVANLDWVKDAPDTTTPFLFRKDVHLQIVFVRSLEDVASLEPTAPSCREDTFRHPCCDHMDECAFSRSVVARGEVSVSMSSFCCSSQTQIEASTSLEAMPTHETAQLLQSGVELRT